MIACLEGPEARVIPLGLSVGESNLRVLPSQHLTFCFVLDFLLMLQLHERARDSIVAYTWRASSKILK